MHAIKLLILKVADRRDPQLVTSIWEAIFVQGMLSLSLLSRPPFHIRQQPVPLKPCKNKSPPWQ